MNQVYSTREMAQMCGVNESTIKRWADSGKLRCMKTPGGHRKFKIKDVLTFFNEYGFEALGMSAEGGPSEAETGNIFPMLVLKHDLPGLSRLYLESAVQKEPREAARVLFNLLTAGFTLSEICDGIVGPAMNEVGNQWREGRISVMEEHLISATTIHALNRMVEMIPRQTPTGKSALCCPANGEAHSIGAEMTGLMLESLGWTTRVTVSPTPFKEITSYVRENRPDMVCLSLVNAPDNGRLREDLDALHSVAAEANTVVAIGGRGAAEAADLRHDFMGQSIKDLEIYARTLTARRRGTEGKTNGRPTE